MWNMLEIDQSTQTFQKAPIQNVEQHVKGIS